MIEVFLLLKAAIWGGVAGRVWEIGDFDVTFDFQSLIIYNSSSVQLCYLFWSPHFTVPSHFWLLGQFFWSNSRFELVRQKSAFWSCWSKNYCQLVVHLTALKHRNTVDVYIINSIGSLRIYMWMFVCVMSNVMWDVYGVHLLTVSDDRVAFLTLFFSPFIC